MAIAAGTVQSAWAQPIEVIYTRKPGDATAVVPGTVSLKGTPAASNFLAMDDLSVAPDGSAWFIRARSDIGTTHDSVYVLGSGLDGSAFVPLVNGTPMVIQEGQLAPFGTGYIDFLPAGSLPRFDDNGNAVLGIRARGNQTSGGTLTDGQRIVKWDAGTNTLTLAFKQGDLYTGLQDVVANPSGDETAGNSIASVSLLNDGTVPTYDPNPGNLHSTRYPVLALSMQGFHQRGISPVQGLGGSGSFVWETFNSGEFGVTTDGMRWYARGRHTNSLSGPQILATGSIATPPSTSVGTVQVEIGQEIPGTGITPTAFVGATVFTNNGDWYSRVSYVNPATTATEQVYIRNGQVLVKVGDLVEAGGTERWATISVIGASENGDWVLAGTTDNGDPATDFVWSLNGEVVLMREGDPVDIDGNGQFDDDAFIGRGNNTLTALTGTMLYLTNDLDMYTVATLRNAAGQDLAPAGVPHAFVRVQAEGGGEPCYANCDESTVSPVLNVADFTCFLQRFAAGESYANCDQSTVEPVLNVADFTCFLQSFAAGCP